MIGIYKIINTINLKVYIGQSINILKRINLHFWKSLCLKDVSYHSALHNAIRKYGKLNFTWEVVELCSVDLIDEKLKYYIQFYNSLTPNGYNILKGGQKNRVIPRFCSCCGTQISKDGVTGMCHKCYSISNRKNLRPDRETLKYEIKNFSFVELGKKYGVSDKAITKWCIQENLPYRKRDIKNFTAQLWLKI